MCNAAYKVNLLSAFTFFLVASTANAQPSRIECLEKIGNSATRTQLDACVKNTTSVPLSSGRQSNSDINSEEATCLDLGFRKKTESYANCVSELLKRKEDLMVSTDPDDATCRKYGFRPKSNEYATCRLQIDQARQDAQRQQAQFLQQQRQYQAQLEEQQRQRSMATGLALMQLGTGISSGALNANNAYGTAPTPPKSNRTYFLPGGKMMNCQTIGNVTDCF